MSFTVDQIANVREDDGIWFASETGSVSYPAEYHQALAGVEDFSFWFRHRNDVILAAVNRFDAGSLFMDIGGGRGFVSRALQNANVTVLLVEPDASAATVARERGVQHILCGTFQEAEFADQVADSIGMFDVIEHIEDSRSFLRAAHRLLVPGGRLYATVPAYRWLWSAEDEYVGHFRRYTSSSLQAELVATGFEIDYISYVFSFLVPPVFLARTVPSLLGLRGTNPNETAKEHLAGGATGRLLNSLCRAELEVVSNGRTLPFGTSLLAVAHKKEN